ncbi:hypothetical protein ACFQS7_27100 [Dankookia sp. GCM10030260]|uniref:hypothetical protein n=1 Tax=Dankookia sp. GCM10030260 TaxID=3273390 RepID=UPI0036120D99
MDDGWVDPRRDEKPVIRTNVSSPCQNLKLATKKRAWKALESDLRASFAAGRVVIEGLQVAPTLSDARSKLRAVWSTLLRFDAARNMIRAGDRTFIDVTVSRPETPAAVVTDIACEAPEITGNPPASAKRPRGQPPAKPPIKICLRAHWDDVRKLAARSPRGVPNWSVLARAVLKWLNNNQRGTHTKFPKTATIRKHLPLIYAELLRDKPER